MRSERIGDGLPYLPAPEESVQDDKRLSGPLLLVVHLDTVHVHNLTGGGRGGVLRLGRAGRYSDEESDDQEEASWRAHGMSSQCMSMVGGLGSCSDAKERGYRATMMTSVLIVASFGLGGRTMKRSYQTRQRMVGCVLFVRRTGPLRPRRHHDDAHLKR